MIDGAEDGPVYDISVSGKLVSSNGGGIRIWDLNTQEMIQRIRFAGLRPTIEWSVDETRLLVAYTRTDPGVGDEIVYTHSIQIMDVASGTVAQEFFGFPVALHLATWNTDETLILSTDFDGAVYITDTHTGETTPILESDVPIFSADWSPYGAQVAVGVALDASVRLSENVISRTEGAIPGLKIVVPFPSVNQLNTLLPICHEDAAADGFVLDGLPDSAEMSQLPELVNMLTQLVDETRHPCLVDALAVTEALTAVSAS
ncbi:MAG: hypothetical protein SGI73_05670 [Chloroflexota bacterium]|nr:hypothetical protein [Chloroflexota bacterium]